MCGADCSVKRETLFQWRLVRLSGERACLVRTAQRRTISVAPLLLLSISTYTPATSDTLYTLSPLVQPLHSGVPYLYQMDERVIIMMREIMSSSAALIGHEDRVPSRC